MDRLVELPDAVSFEQAACLPTAYLTAYRMLRRARLQAGETVVVSPPPELKAGSTVANKE